MEQIVRQKQLTEIRLLIVDDQSASHRLIKNYFEDNTFLEDNGYKANILIDDKIGYVKGKHDLERYFNNTDNVIPDLILLDWTFEDGNMGNTESGKKILEWLMDRKRKGIKGNNKYKNYTDINIIVISNKLIVKGHILDAFAEGAVATFSKSIVEDYNYNDLSNSILSIYNGAKNDNIAPQIGRFVTRNHKGILREINMICFHYNQYLWGIIERKPHSIATIPSKIKEIIYCKDTNSVNFRYKKILIGIATGKTIDEIRNTRDIRFPNFNKDKSDLVNILREGNSEKHEIKINTPDHHIILLKAIEYRIPKVIEYFKTKGIFI